jgi:hypothetical protein
MKKNYQMPTCGNLRCLRSFESLIMDRSLSNFCQLASTRADIGDVDRVHENV